MSCLEDIYDIDHTTIPRRPGSSRFRVLPDISTDASSSENRHDSDEPRTMDPELELLKTAKDTKIVTSVDAKKVRRGQDSVKSKSIETKDGISQGKSVPHGSNLTARLSPKVKEGNKAVDTQKHSLTSSRRIEALNDDLREMQVDSKTNKISLPNQRTAGKQPNSKQTAKKAVALPPEPGSGEKSVILAIKLPSGERLQRRFRPSDRLQSILQFAGACSPSCSADGCELVCLEPKAVFSDMRKTIEQCKIPDKTLLYIQLPEPE